MLTNMPAKKGMGQPQLSQKMGNLQKKNPADSARQHEKAPTFMHQTHDPTKSAKLSSSARTWAARDPLLGAGHEQPKAGKVESETGQTQPQPGGIFSAVLSSPQKSGGEKFKIPTLKRVSNQPGDHAPSILSGNDVSSVIIICGRHGPSPATLKRATPTTTRRAQHERKAQPARPHPLEEGNEQAGSNSLQLGGESTPHAALAQCTLQPMKPSIKAKPSTQHMLTPARDLPFGAGHEQAKHVRGPTPTTYKQKKSDDRKMLQQHAQAPTPLQVPQDHGANAMIRAQRLAQNAPHHSLEDGHGQAGSNSQQLRRESTPHATLGSDMLQPSQSITNAKLRLLLRSVPGNVPAKRGMGQQQLGQKMGNLQKKNPADSARQ